MRTQERCVPQKWTICPSAIYTPFRGHLSKTHMYTQSNVYAKKISSGTILALLFLSAILLIVPVGPVYGSTGHPAVGYVTTQATLTGFTASTNYVNVSAGSAVSGNDCGATFPASCAGGVQGYLALDFAGVTFSGSQFALYLSRDGLSQISAGDIPFAGGLTDNHLFSTSQLAAGPVTTVVEKNGTFYLGNTNLMSGPIPADVPSNYKYIKIFDGTTTSVAVSAQYISIMPGISVISQVTGAACTLSLTGACAAGTPVTVSGGGFPAGKTIGINYSYAFVSWLGAGSTKSGVWLSGISTGPGYFSKSAVLLDTKQAENPVTAGYLYSGITFTATTSAHPQSSYATATASAYEILRVFNQVESLKPDGSVSSIQTGTFGNDTGATTWYPNLAQPINVYSTGSVGVAGNHSMVGAAITVKIGSTAVPTTQSAPVADNLGQYVINFTVPALSNGIHHVYVIDNGVPYEFDINVLPTVILTPHSGPAGTTVAVTLYGFPANRWVNIYWNQVDSSIAKAYFEANGTVGADGSYNVTVTFTVPHSYGGGHLVYATNNWYGMSVSTPLADLNSTYAATFTVTATLEICNGSTCGNGFTNASTVSVDANTRGLISATGSGFIADYWYQVNIDNALFNDYEILASTNGDLWINFTAAGLRPGLHQVEFYTCCTALGPSPYIGSRSPQAYAYFNVTTKGDYISTQITGISASVSSAVNTALTGFGTQLTSIQNSITALGTQISSLQTTLAGDITSSTNTITAAITSAQGALNTAIGAATTAAQGAQTAAQQANTSVSNLSGGNSSTQTYVLVVAVLAAITLVLELAILVRKLS